MIIQRHRLPTAAFLALASGESGADEAGRIAAGQRSRNILVLHAVVRAAASVRHPAAGAAASAYQLLADVARTAPEAVASVVHYPQVSLWAMHTVRRLSGAEANRADPGFLAAVAAAAVVRARLPATLVLPQPEPGGRVCLPSLGSANLTDGDGSVELRATAGGAELRRAKGETWQRVAVPRDPHRIEDGWYGLPLLTAAHGGLRLAVLFDALDLTAVRGSAEAGTGEPERPDVAADEPRSPAAVAQWRALLEGAWSLLVEHHRRTAVDAATLLTMIAPLRARSGVSATPNDGFGCVTMTRPRDPTAFAVIFAHELQHVKLTAVHNLFPLVGADDGQRYYAPWRDDPRPPIGLLHGAYAHLGITKFWRGEQRRATGAASHHAGVEFTRWRAATDEVCRTLLGGDALTAAGRLFVTTMHTTVRQWLCEPVSGEAARTAARLAEKHRTSYLARDALRGR